MLHTSELIWLACAIAFLGSFGLGCTLENLLREARKRGDDGDGA